MGYPHGIADQPSMVTLIMASRRSGEGAQATRERFVETTAQTMSGSGILLDRTPEGVLWSPSTMETIRDLGSRFSVVRQGYEAPISDVWRELVNVSGAWIMQFHDDDRWIGQPSIPHLPEPDVTLYAPNLLVANGVLEHPAHEWTSQHALFGALRSDVFRIVARYLSSAPNPWGGEDLMILSLAGALGQIRRQADYTYVWHQGNWTAETGETSTQMYLADQGWGNLSSLSTYLLLQSLDRLAVYSMASEVPEETWRLGVEGSLDTFWPVIDAKGHRILRRLPPSLRGAMIATRGGGNGPRRMVRFLKAASFPAREMHQVDSFKAFEIGRSLVSTPLDVSERLLPALADVAPPEAQPQIEYWRSCVSMVASRYSRHGE